MDPKVREHALHILDKRDVSRKMLTDKLTEKGASPEDAEEAADWLCSIGAVNDERFAGLVVRHYGRKGYGVRRIQEELYRRGIDRSLWEAAMAELPETEDTVYALFARKMSGTDGDDKALQRACGYLQRRGYSWEEIRSAMERYKQVIEEDQ